MPFSHHVIIFEEYFLPQGDFKCIYIKFIFEFFKKTIFLAKNGKIFFAANTLNIMNSSPLVNCPKKRSIDSSFQSEKKNRRRNPIYGFWSKKFFFRNSLNSLIMNPHRSLGVKLMSVTRFSNVKGEWQGQLVCTMTSFMFHFGVLLIVKRW